MRGLPALLLAVTLVTAAACVGPSAPTANDGGASSLDPAASGDPSSRPALSTATSAPATVVPSGPAMGAQDELCLRVADVELSLAALRAVELRLPNRVALDIELDKLMAAFVELQEVDLGDREEELERSLTRLAYRLGELELAVEDFRTNTRPRRASPHVEDDAQRVASELAAFAILSRC